MNLAVVIIGMFIWTVIKSSSLQKVQVGTKKRIKKAVSLEPGNVIVTDKGVKHWHGAKKDSEFAHIAITAGKSEFYEAVSDEEYSRLG